MRHVFAGICGVIAVGAWSGTPGYTYLRTIDIAPHPTAARMIDGCVDSNGGLYFVDNSIDAIFYIPDVLTADGALETDVVPIIAGEGSISGGGGPDFNSGFSYEGITFDGTNIYAGGRQSTADAQYVKLVPNNASTPTGWTVTVYTINQGLSGPGAVGAGTFAAANNVDGSVVFLGDAGATLNVLGTVAGSTGRAHNLVFDDTTNRIYVSTSRYFNQSPPSVGQVEVFTSDGTAGGTSYNAAVNPYVESTPTGLADTVFGVNYQTLGFNEEDQVLLICRSTGFPETNGHALVDATQPGPNATPYQLIDLADTPQGANTGSATGGTFGIKDGVKFLAVCAGTNKIHIYSQPSNVQDWTLY